VIGYVIAFTFGVLAGVVLTLAAVNFLSWTE